MDPLGPGSVAGEPPRVAAGCQVSVLGSFRFTVGDTALPSLARGSQHLLAFLALQDRRMARTAVAGTLWPEVSDSHAHSSLRSALSRLSQTARDAVLVTSSDLCIGPSVTVDLRDARALSHRLLEADAVPEEADLTADSVRILSTDLLPDWYDDWVLLEAENWRQLRLHALESLAGRLLDKGQIGDAAGAAGAAVDAEPLRESARAVLIRVHLAEGNQAEAIDEFERYQGLLATELGVEPTEELRSLAHGG